MHGPFVGQWEAVSLLLSHELIKLEILQVDAFADTFGPLHPLTLATWGGLIHTYDLLGYPDHARSTLIRVVSMCESNFGPLDPRTLRIRWTSGIHYLRHNEYHDALTVGESLKRHSRHLLEGNHMQDVDFRRKVHLRASGFEIVAQAQAGLGNLPSAILHDQEAIEIHKKGKVFTRILPLLVQLERWLREDGQEIAAARIRKEVTT